MEECRLEVCHDRQALAAKASSLIVECARESLRDRGRFTIVLCGGSTPEETYLLWTQSGQMAPPDWQKTHVFFGDERFVPADDPRSNFGMADRALLSRAPVPPSQVFPVPTQRPSAAEAAKAYADQLVRFFATDGRASPPRFDLVLLGLGEDGHTASLFPGSPALEVTDAWVTWSPPGTLPPPVDRVTLTYPVLTAARHVVFLVAGEGKAPALRDGLEGKVDRRQRPAAGIQPVDGTLTWLVDESAAKLLARQSCP